MKILHVLNDINDKGNGIVNAAIDLASGQVSAGDIAAIASNSGGLQTLVREAGIEWYCIDFTRRPVTLLRALLSFNRVMRTFKPDILHAHMRTGLLFGWFFAKLYRCKLVGHLHNIHEANSVLMGRADRVIVVSDSVASSLAEQGVPRSKIRTVLNGPLGSPRLGQTSGQQQIKLNHPAIVTVAGMNHRKGIGELLQAFSIVAQRDSHVHLYLVGGGPDEKEFQAQALGLTCADRIEFVGRSKYPQAFMNEAEIFVLASRRDSFPLVLAEARQAGCAIVASDVDGIPEGLDYGRAGLLFPPMDVEALAESLCSLIENSSSRREYSRRAREGLERFSYHAFAKNTRMVYSELLEETLRSEAL